MDRREFLTGTTAAGIMAAIAPQLAAGRDEAPVPRRRLGKTGREVSIIGYGGIVAMGRDQREVTREIIRFIDRGVNYFDVAPSYGNGEAEERLGPALLGRRDGLFLACKTERRDRQGAREALETSLKRLRTDHFDLYQLHAITTLEDVEKALGPGGAMETFVGAREKGYVRYLGFSAHSVEAALEAMRRFDFDTILFPFNWVCWMRGNFGPQVLKEARRRGMGCLALKAMAKAPWPAGAERTAPKCWYEPHFDPAEAALALRFTLSLDVTAAIPPGDERLFPLALEVASRFKPLTEAERRQLQAKAETLEPLFRHNA